MEQQQQAPIGQGDRVRLNSGGPEMTVIAITQHVTVAWQDELGVAHHCSLPAPCLRPAS